MPLRTGQLVGPYEVVAPLGAGGMGEVYRARDSRLRRDVAIKVLPDSFLNDPERLARFEREAQMLAALNCPNIAAIYGIEESGSVRGLLLELVEGPTLFDRLRGGRLPIAEAVGIARQLVEALDAAHERGIVHRDLKPANIKITPEGVVKVLDFGLAKSANAPPSPDLTASPTVTSDGTRAGVILGTALYMSPEQARGHIVDKRTDIWAFGCVLYEMLTGHRAFDGPTFADVSAAILHRDPDWTRLPDSTPAAIKRLLMRLLDKDPKRRLRDIADVRMVLEDAAAEEDAERARPASARPWQLASVVLAAMLATALMLGAPSLVTREPLAGPSLDRSVAVHLTNYGGSEASGAIAPDGRSFAFVSEHAGTPDIFVRQVAGGDPVRLTNDGAIESELQYAPDSESVYFTRFDAGERSIWNVLALGGRARKIVTGGSNGVPSPDGSRLAWTVQQGDGSYDLLVGGEQGGTGRTLVSRLPSPPPRVAWSRDGNRLAYATGGLFTPRNVFVIVLATGQVRQVTSFTGSATGPFSAVWLPDNRHLAITYSPTPGALRRQDLGVLDLDTGRITRLTSSLSESFQAPTISEDGSRLVATAVVVEREVWKVPFGADALANGRDAVRVLDASFDPMWTFVSRDGRTLLFNNAVIGSRNLWTMPLDGPTGPRQITSIPGDAVMHSALSPDGTMVAFASNSTGQADIWVQNVDGSNLRQLTNDAGANAWPMWSPDGRTIMFSAADGSETWKAEVTGGRTEKVASGFFRGDWITTRDGRALIATSTDGGAGLRVMDEKGTVRWEKRTLGNGMPAFSPDGTLISLPYRESRNRDAIWVYETGSGESRVAVRFPQPFTMSFRASWVDNGRAFIVNRYRETSRIVMFDQFWQPDGKQAAK